MTDSAPDGRRGGKRERLIASAADLLHRQGVQRTTLAEIAADADVPPGNVYYYFKTWDELIRAVIDSRAEQIRGMLGSFDARPTPHARLKELVGTWATQRDLVARFGCPIGTLSSELEKRDDAAGREATGLFGLLTAWAESQFQQMGCTDAGELAITLLAGVEGATVLANAFRDPEIVAGQVRRLERWIDSLAEDCEQQGRGASGG